MKEIFDLINTGHPASVSDGKIESAINILRTDPGIKRLNDAEYLDTTFTNYVAGEYALILTDPGELKGVLFSNLGKGVYDWFFQKLQIDRIIKQHAEDKYKKEYVRKVLSRIDALEDQKVKAYLKDLVKNEPIVGIKIMRER